MKRANAGRYELFKASRRRHLMLDNGRIYYVPPAVFDARTCLPIPPSKEQMPDLTEEVLTMAILYLEQAYYAVKKNNRRKQVLNYSVYGHGSIRYHPYKEIDIDALEREMEEMLLSLGAAHEEEKTQKK